MLNQLSGVPVTADSISWLLTPQRFREALLSKIAQAEKCVYLSALYLENDEAGRQVLDALLQAKESNPQLDIKVFVDFHRARRGLIGHKSDSGNDKMYRERMAKAQQPIEIYGVPVKAKEFLGVLHLKGFVIDDTVFFSGASLNNIYLHFGDKYRFDRYYTVESAELAKSMVSFMKNILAQDDAVKLLSESKDKELLPTKAQIRSLKGKLSRQQYEFSGSKEGSRITPIVGLGRKKNLLNKVVLSLVKEAEKSLFICTPYFNPPYALTRVLIKQLKKGKRVDIVVGDKTANDFFIPPEEKFSTIGAVPYIYEQSLRTFVKRQQWAIDAGLLNIHLWKHEHHSFHLKGISADNCRHLVTGSNLNPRAWALDLENGLFINDEKRLWKNEFSEEQKHILQHTHRLYHYSQLETLQVYPDGVKKILLRIKRLRAGFLLKRIL
ncbi:CDP-diacylglycerol--serine O-phosphatidyltransferase [Parashewanella spongiae]|uniref:CDP-diacylglycerol--serine O-phosphatidyltransferase n=1 Tax=Parashewanella spongiae TaxID=342950 RepID=A0A3A6THN5_9GAMM|nr:CDP-diacylglycerol--serine O-phosphatidyltransferase [Parashewanella spongiae]MCL1078680.1 CDP-diacylglycerol--serine O-phosphatidyltransferase [Parashewanella spongiae]RJY12947.1 CDP-diacylglycerol--serine O-phosphatidyltransferase [Parashewanella spongiae]